MKIAYTCPSYAPSIGGVETHIAQIATRLAAAGHTIEVLTEQRGTTLPAVEEVDGVIVRRFSIARAGGRYGVAPGLWRHIIDRGGRYDVLHAQSYHAFTSLAATLAVSRPVVFTPHYHGTGSTTLGRLLHVPYRIAGLWLFHRANRVICVSRAEAQLVQRHFPFASGRITVIPNGVDGPALARAEPFARRGRIVLTAGRLKRYKNVHRVIETLCELDRSYTLCVVGDGPALPELQALVERLGLAERVRFAGPVDDPTLRRWYRTADVYVVMSEQEAFGLTILESLAAGSPVVASDITAHREIKDMTGADTLCLVPLHASPVDLSRAIVDAAEGPPGAGPVRLPTWDTAAAQTLDVYRAVLRR